MHIFPATFPASRPRRLRRDAFTRNLVRENRLTAHDLIYPVFILEGKNRREAVASMPGVERISVDLLLAVAEDCVQLGIPAIALFPLVDEQRAEGEAAIARWNDAHLGQKAVTTIEGPATWYAAEDYHQEYWQGEGQRNPYCLAVIPPKLAKLQKGFAEKLKG